MEAPHEVWARAAWAAIDLAEVGGLPIERLFDGVPFDATSVRRLKRVTWNDYCRLAENLDAITGGDLEDLLEAAYHQTFPEIRAIAGAIVDSKLLVRFFSRVASPLLFPPVEFEYEDFGGRHVRMTFRLRAGARPCEPWFRGSTGAIRGIPRYLNLPPAVVTAKISPDLGVYDIELPPARTIAGRASDTVRLAISAVLGVDHDGTPIGGTFGELGASAFDTRVHAAILTWKLTPRQGEVLRRVAHGESNKEIARSLGCAENTIELHVTQLLRKTGVTSRTQLIARLWSD